MMKSIVFILATILTLAACQKTEKQLKQRKFGEPNVTFDSIKKEFSSWWTYHNTDIDLSSDFIAIDTSYSKISKDAFLKRLTSGEYIPLKLNKKDSVNYYQLFELDTDSDKSIVRTIKNDALMKYKFFKMEDEPFPNFNFTDINGNIYTNENTKGKIILLKCWFISCVPCVAEMPELNKLVAKYKERDDVLFISLAFDTKDELEMFLTKTQFDYAVVPNKREFMESALKVAGYPTHFIIDKNGFTQTVATSLHRMLPKLKKAIEVTANESKLPPPPPPRSKTK